jgi:hypothetical protein
VREDNLLHIGALAVKLQATRRHWRPAQVDLRVRQLLPATSSAVSRSRSIGSYRTAPLRCWAAFRAEWAAVAIRPKRSSLQWGTFDRRCGSHATVKRRQGISHLHSTAQEWRLAAPAMADDRPRRTDTFAVLALFVDVTWFITPAAVLFVGICVHAGAVAARLT